VTRIPLLTPTGSAGDESIQAEVSDISLSIYPEADDNSPYDVLDVPFGATESEVKKKYRKISLMIHPDKFKHENGPEVSTSFHLKFE
jgi:DnaJ family protein C protein 8